MLMTHELFLSAEVDYRSDRIKKDLGHGRRPRRTPRRRTLHLPRPRLRPLHVA